LNIEHSTLNIEHRREEKEEEKRKRIYREGAKVAKERGVRRVKSYFRGVRLTEEMRFANDT
jgi:hypothetical protein